MIRIIENLRGVSERIGRLRQDLDRQLEAAALSAALEVERQAKLEFKKGGYRKGPRGGRVPTPKPRWPYVYRRTGFLSRSINVATRRDSDGWVGIVGAWAPYARRLELGGGGIRARHWLRRAHRKARDRVKEIFDRAVREAIRG